MDRPGGRPEHSAHCFVLLLCAGVYHIQCKGSARKTSRALALVPRTLSLRTGLEDGDHDSSWRLARIQAVELTSGTRQTDWCAITLSHDGLVWRVTLRFHMKLVWTAAATPTPVHQ